MGKHATKTKEERELTAQEEKLAARIVRLDQYRQAGAVFNYPDGLLPEEWDGLAAYNNARQRAFNLADPNKP